MSAMMLTIKLVKACWYETQKKAEKFLQRFARERDWQKAV